MKTLYLLSIPFLLLAAQCIPEKPEPPEPQLPPITTTGENTFGCKINGEVWLPKGYFPNVPGIVADWNSGGFSIYSNRKTNDHHTKVGVYGYYLFIPKLFKIKLDSINFLYLNRGCEYENNKINEGELNILKIDTIERIISGTFWFKGSAKGCEDIEVTDGRFDINY